MFSRTNASYSSLPSSEDTTPDIKKILKRRLKQLCEHIQGGIAILPAGPHLDKDSRFHAHSNFFYFSHLEQPGAIILVRNVREQQHFAIFWQEADEKEKIWNGPRMSLEDVKKFTGANVVYPLDLFYIKLPEYLENTRNIYYTFGIDSVVDKNILDARARLLRQNFLPTVAPMTIWDLEKIVEDMRICKDAYEISCIRRAAQITANAYQEAFRQVKPGMYEYEVEAWMDYMYRKAGCLTSFATIVASGANATVLHYTKNESRLSNKELLLLDSGARYKHYCADVTRTWPVGGKFTSAQKAIYGAVLDAQKSSIDSIRPGFPIEDFHTASVHKLVEHMIELKILSGKKGRLIAQKAYQKFYMHRTGHQLGLDVHDLGGYYRGEKPRIFEPGMVITVEPGIYIHPESKNVPSQFKGIGVRIEDDILVTNTGHEVLTSSIHKEIEELEDMNS